MLIPIDLFQGIFEQKGANTTRKHIRSPYVNRFSAHRDNLLYVNIGYAPDGQAADRRARGIRSCHDSADIRDRYPADHRTRAAPLTRDSTFDTLVVIRSDNLIFGIALPEIEISHRATIDAYPQRKDLTICDEECADLV